VGIPEGEEKGKACIKNLYHEIVTKNVWNLQIFWV
jgi:hypothetical protein